MACHIRGLTEVPSKGHPSPCPGCPGAGGACAESSGRGLSPWHRVTALPSSAAASSSPGVAEPNPATFLPLWFGFLNNPRGCRQTEEASCSLSSPVLSRDRAEHHRCVGVTSVPWGAPELGQGARSPKSPLPEVSARRTLSWGVSLGWGGAEGLAGACRAGVCWVLAAELS